MHALFARGSSPKARHLHGHELVVALRAARKHCRTHTVSARDLSANCKQPFRFKIARYRSCTSKASRSKGCDFKHSYASGVVFRTDGAQGVGIVNAMRGATVAIVSHLCFCSPSKPLQCLTPLSAASAAIVTAGGIVWVRSASPVQVGKVYWPAQAHTCPLTSPPIQAHPYRPIQMVFCILSLPFWSAS